MFVVTTSHVLWGIFGGIIGAALAAIVFWVVMLSRRKEEPPKLEEAEKAPLPAFFEVTDFLISPSRIKEGETVTVMAQVRNSGGTTGNYSVTLKLDGRLVAMKGVSLDPGATELVSFNISERQAGEHLVEIDGLKGMFLIPPAKFTLSNLTVTPERVKERQKVDVTVKVTNEGGSTGSYLAELKIRGLTEMAQEVTLSPGASQILNFTVVKKNAGFYPVEIGDSSGKIIVEMADFVERI